MPVVIIPALSANPAKISSISPLEFNPQPSNIPSDKLPLSSRMAMIVPPTVPTVAMTTSNMMNQKLVAILVIFVLMPIQTKNKGIRNPKAMMWIDLAISCSSQLGMTTSLMMVCRISIPATMAPIKTPTPKNSDNDAINNNIMSDPMNRAVLDFSLSKNLRANGSIHILAMTMAIRKIVISTKKREKERWVIVTWNSERSKVARNNSMISSTAPAVMIMPPIFDFTKFNSFKSEREIDW